MNKQLLSIQLREFGLDDVEGQIYLNLLESGPKTPLDLSRETGVNRTKIYRYIDRLKAKKLVEESYLGRGLTLKATGPEALELLIFEKERQMKAQKELLPQLIKGLAAPGIAEHAFEIKHYHGQEGLKQMLRNQLSAKKEILLYGYQTRNEIVGASFADKLREEQMHRKIVVYEIEEEVDPGNFTGKFTYTKVSGWGKKYYVPRYVDPKILKIRQYTAIFNNTVSIMNWEHGQKVGVEIVNELYAGMQRQIFWGVWKKIAMKPTHHTLAR